ncbi:short-chain dehydrogenase [Advenella faeciporci]|uniref:Short-chain dehydrogenase n=1 Tax=Advenella faeciporci TaxID=797535 RepID=A0A918MWG0_9BURK|nr:SDR family oxidoreductase [Advenella faeciporci]GGW79461.1 short-chain dehydrogenase [Advenella faeciporci]
MKNKCVLVTGATKGIGWAISRRLSDAGAHVIGLARHVDEIDFPGFLYQCDLNDAGQTEDVLRMIREKYPVDAIVNNVGVVLPEILGEISLASFYQVYDLNVRSAIQVVQAFSDVMKQRQEGRIINIASIASHGSAGKTSYSAAKSALVACTKTWALELADYGITVNAISPGPVETQLLRESYPVGSEKEKQLLADIPLKRLARPEEIAAAVQFLLSHDAAFITGQVLQIDGGKSL